MRLVDGALAIRDDLPTASTVLVDVPLEAGESQGTKVARFSSLQLVRDRQALALSRLDDWALTIGGDCGVELASISHVADSQEIAVLWFDAHPDLNTPESSPSAAFTGMVLRTLIGDGEPGLVPAHPIAPGRILLVGARSFDDAESDYAASAGIRSFTPDEATVDALVAAIEASGATSVYVHVDLDVLDPAEFGGIGYPEPFGVETTALTGLIRGVRERFALAGAGITEFAPADAAQAADDLPTILRIIGALTA
ncbi:MAG: arginase [Actinomycetota bacterium]|nr:arginase [Actinomycetota bacterium]